MILSVIQDAIAFLVNKGQETKGHAMACPYGRGEKRKPCTRCTGQSQFKPKL